MWRRGLAPVASSEKLRCDIMPSQGKSRLLCSKPRTRYVDCGLVLCIQQLALRVMAARLLLVTAKSRERATVCTSGVTFHLTAVEARGRDIGALFARRVLNEDSNLCYGEGGAGTGSKRDWSLASTSARQPHSCVMPDSCETAKKAKPRWSQCLEHRSSVIPPTESVVAFSWRTMSGS